MILHEKFDPELLTRFRKKHGLTKSAMVRLLQGHGFRKLAQSTYASWEASTHAPLDLAVEAIKKALETEGPRLEAARKQGKDVEV